MARVDGSILEGAIDLLYEQPDGTLVVVDYKTDRVTDAEVGDTRRELSRAG